MLVVLLHILIQLLLPYKIYYFFISKFSTQQYHSKIIKYTIQFMHTWILKDEQVATYIAPEK